MQELNYRLIRNKWKDELTFNTLSTNPLKKAKHDWYNCISTAICWWISATATILYCRMGKWSLCPETDIQTEEFVCVCVYVWL